jgi:tRNA threonylcarbamoyladenosine biosynthesis protein TsaE
LFSLLTKGEEETISFGKALGELLIPGDVLIVTGELGSGKTRLIKGMCLGLGLGDTKEVTSPTFTLLQVYQGRVPIYHMDYYRLNTKEEVLDSGLDPFEYWDGVVMVEWGEKFPELLTRPFLQVIIKEVSDFERLIQLETSLTTHNTRVMEALKKLYRERN